MADTPPESAPGREPAAADPDAGPALGPPPEVLGRAAIRARAFAKLFGDDDDHRPLAELDTEVPNGASRSGVIEEVPEQIGRFKVLGRIGGGGMGVVVRAHDPELDRHVAIKLLRAELRAGSAGSVGPARLLREAQAMARINDPNVITVHEVGTVGDQVFIAMELVDGDTLAAWLRATKRPWRVVLDVFMRAGDGIAAAHAAGVVHRDFKPDNVLIGKDGRVRVVDFGLARAAGTALDVTISDPASATGPIDPMKSPLTRTGAVMGTPAYMSPEQYLGHPAGERSDQFSFCVALYEALFGRRPFPGTTITDLAAAVVAGRIREPPTDVVPRFVIAGLRRGLARDPADRFATMTELLAALRRDPARRWRRVGAAAVIAATASIVGFAVARRDDSRCDDVGQRLVGVWDEDARANVRTAILATAAPFAERTWQSAERLLDAYAGSWRELATQTCAGSRVSDADARELGARRERCLDARLAELDGLVDLLAAADPAMAILAVDAAARLPDLGGCADSHRLAAWHDASDPQVRERLQQARTRLAHAGAEGGIGRYKLAITIAQEAVDIATELGDPALEAAALLVRGQNEERAGEVADAEATLRRAVQQAELAEDHGTRAQALIHLVYVMGDAKDERRRAETLAIAADAGAVLRVLAADPLLRAQLDNNLAVAAKRAGDLDDALVHLQQALATYEELFGEQHPSTLRALMNLGNVLRAQRRFAEAEAMLRRASDGFELVLGAEHPFVAVTLSNLAITLAHQGHAEDAVPVFRRSLEIREKNDPAHPDLGKGHFNLARALYDTRAYDEALTEYERGLELRRRAGAKDAELVDYYEGIGQSAARMGAFDRAREQLETAIAIHERKGDAEPLAKARTELALLLGARDPKRVLELAVPIQEWLDARAKASPDLSADDRSVADQLAFAVTLAENQLRAQALTK